MVERAQIVWASPRIAHAPDCMPHNLRQEFLAFLSQKVRSVPKDLAVRVILDNYATHKHASVKGWLARHRRVHFHFTPTSAPRLNLVERFFGALTEGQIRRLAVTSVDELIAVITRYIDQRNKKIDTYEKTFSNSSVVTRTSASPITFASNARKS
jgi:transposase